MKDALIGRVRREDGGFTMIELLVAMTITLVVSGMVVGATMDLGRLAATMTNRADMHAGLRNATALLQQEVGQAGRIALPGPVALTNPVAIGVNPADVNSVAGMFVGERLSIGFGPNEETVTVTAIDLPANRFTADFQLAHAVGEAVSAVGGFSAGVIPTTMANGSSGSVLKILGDINDDRQLAYVEYTCDFVNGRLLRNVMDFDAPAKPAITVEQILLNNLLPNPPNPDGTIPPCFTYQENTFNGTTYVIGVAIMTTVRTQERERSTNQFQVVTKALLNVSPRNVVNVWQLASLGYQNRVQPLPPSVAPLLP